MKKILISVLVLSLLLAGCSSSTSSNPASTPGSGYEKLNLKMSTSDSDQDSGASTARYFAELVEEASGGNIKITVYPNSQLAGGSQPKNIELLIAGGNYELAVLSGSVLGNIEEKFLTHQIPFIFDSYEAVTEKLDGTGREYYEKLFEEKGLVYMDAIHNGLRQLTNNKLEVKTPEDIRSMKIRVPSGEVYMRTLREFGSDPVAMNWSEVFTALQQTTIDGHENSFKTIDSSNIYEVQKYVTEWNWSYDGLWLMSNQKDWNKFSDATKDLLMEKAREAALWGRKQTVDVEAELKQKFRDHGVTVTELTSEERAKFIEVARPAQEYFIEKFGEEACSAWGLN